MNGCGRLFDSLRKSGFAILAPGFDYGSNDQTGAELTRRVVP